MTVDAVMEMMEQAKSDVEKQLKLLIPQKTEKRTVSGGGTAGKTSPRPKTMKEAMELAARGEYNP